MRKSTTHSLFGNRIRCEKLRPPAAPSQGPVSLPWAHARAGRVHACASLSRGRSTRAPAFHLVRLRAVRRGAGIPISCGVGSSGVGSVLRSFFRHRSRRGVLRRAWSHACFIIVASAARAAPGIRICMAANSDQVSDLVNLVASLMLHATRVNVVGGLGFQALRGPRLGAQWQRCQIRRASRLCTETSGCRRTARFVTVICC